MKRQHENKNKQKSIKYLAPQFCAYWPGNGTNLSTLGLTASFATSKREFNAVSSAGELALLKTIKCFRQCIYTC